MLVLKQLLQHSQATLARELNLAPATIAQLLNKEIFPKKPTTAELKKAIGGFLRKQHIAFDDTMFNTVAVEAATPLIKEDTTMSMLLEKKPLSQQAKSHFKIFQDPFKNDVRASSDVFNGSNTAFISDYMWSAAKTSGGFIAVVGESGAGKSTLRKKLIDRVNREQEPIIIIEPIIRRMEDNDKKGKTLKSGDIEDAIIYTLSPLDKPRQSAEAKGRQLQRLLVDSSRAGNSHCLIIEEAHCLPIPTLKHLKRFHEMENGFDSLLSVILIGQPELTLKLAGKAGDVREVSQRCELIEIAPLDKQLEEYLTFKFSRVGASLEAVFEKDALAAIRERLTFAKSSKNNHEQVSLLYPLMINNLVTKAMNLAATLGFAKVSFDLIKEA
jgi:type II secretory pathway predicted ATPase ExeA